jgi:hypothetical protein
MNIHFKKHIYNLISENLACTGDIDQVSFAHQQTKDILEVDKNNIYFSPAEKQRIISFLNNKGDELKKIPQDDAVTLLGGSGYIEEMDVNFDIVAPEYFSELLEAIHFESEEADDENDFDSDEIFCNTPLKFDNMTQEEVWDIIGKLKANKITQEDFFNLNCLDKDLIRFSLLAYLIGCDYKKYIDKLSPYFESIDFEDFIPLILNYKQYELTLVVLDSIKGSLIFRKIFHWLVEHIVKECFSDSLQAGHLLTILQKVYESNALKFIKEEDKIVSKKTIEFLLDENRLKMYSIQNQNHMKQIAHILQEIIK